MRPKHKIFSAICSDQEYSWICNGGTLTQNLFSDFQLSRKLFDMHWWDLNTKSFRRFAAIKNTYSHALMGPKHKIFSAICSDQEYSWRCIGGTLTQNLFDDFQLSRIFFWHALVGPEHKIFSVISSYQENFLTCIGGTLTQSLFGDFQLSRKLFDMHWWDLNTECFRRFAAIKNTYCNASVGPYHKVFSAIFSYQEYLLTCIGGTWTRNLFGDLQLARILIVMYWWDLTTKSFRRFSAIKNTFWHALAGL